MAKSSKKSSAKTSKTASKSVAVAKPVRQTWHDDAKEPKSGQTVMDACIALMRRPQGAGISDFQTVKGFKVSSMTVVRAALARGLKAAPYKKAGERTVYKASGTPTK